MSNLYAEWGTDYRDGVRFIAVRETDCERWLDMLHIADTADEAIHSAERSDAFELGPDWAAENRLVGAAVVRLNVLGIVAPGNLLAQSRG